MLIQSFRGGTRAVVLAGLLASPWCTAASAQTELKVSLNAPYDGSNAAFFLAEEKGY